MPLWILTVLAATGGADAVYELSPAADATVIGVSLSAAVVPDLFAADLIHPRCPCDPAEVNAFDRSVIGNHSAFADVFSTVSVGVALVGPLVLDAADVGFGSAFFTDAIVYLEALSVDGALVTAAKYSVQRPLPVVYSGDAPGLIGAPGGYRSFYSGHTTLTAAALFTAAGTWTRRHGQSPWPWLAAALFTASVGMERLLAGRHFPSDVLVGATVGALVGLAVPGLHARHGSVGVALTPLPGGAQVAIGGALP